LDAIRAAECVGDAELVDTGNTDDIACECAIGLNAMQTVVTHHLQNFSFTLVAFVIDYHELLVRRQAAASNTANTDNPNITAVIQRRNLHLERAVGVNLW